MWFSTTYIKWNAQSLQEVYSFHMKFLLWQEISIFDQNIKRKYLLSQSYESKLQKIWKSAWLFIYISCNYSILLWKILPAFPVNILPWWHLSLYLDHIIATYCYKGIQKVLIRLGKLRRLWKDSIFFRLQSQLNNCQTFKTLMKALLKILALVFRI